MSTVTEHSCSSADTKGMDAPRYYAEYENGAAITANLAALYERDGIAHGRIVLTDTEFAAIAAYARTLPSTPANNVWD